MKYNVIIYDFNNHKFESYDIFKYLKYRYDSIDKLNKPKTFQEFKEFIIRWSRYEWWARCEYEMILTPWPPNNKVREKWDIHKQITMNIDNITKLFMEFVQN